MGGRFLAEPGGGVYHSAPATPATPPIKGLALPGYLAHKKPPHPLQ